MSKAGVLARHLLRWRTDRSRAFVTAAVKVGYELSSGRVAACLPFGPGDVAPHKPFAEVMVRGRLRNDPLPRFAGFAIARGVDVLVQKTTLIRGHAAVADGGAVFATRAAPPWSPPDGGIVPVFRADHDATGFLVSPQDQWLDHLAGGEAIRLLGFAAVADDFSFRLPRLAPRGVLRLADRRARHVPFVADTLSVDADGGRVVVVYRGAVELFAGDELASSPETCDALEVALHPSADDGRSLGRPPAWVRAKQAERPPVSPVVDRFELTDTSGFASLARPWSYAPGDQRRLVVVKATYRVSPDGRGLTLVDDQAPPQGDQFNDDGVIEYASDFAPFKHEVDLVVKGAARAAEGDATATVAVRLSGMQAAFEIAAGAPVRLGPIGPLDDDRVARLGTFDGAWLDERWPHLPADCDPRAFQCAPPALRMAVVRGGDRLVVSGLLEGGALIDLALPVERPRVCALYDPSGPVVDVATRLDTVVLDATAMLVHLVWRGTYPVAASGGLERAVVVRVSDDADASAAVVARAIASVRAPAWSDVVPSARRAGGSQPLEAAFASWAKRSKELAAETTAAPRPPPPAAARADVLRDVAAGASLAGRDLTRVDLAGADLRSADLKGAILRGATLDDAVLEGADLSGAVLAASSMRRALLDGANLKRADLRAVQAEGASLRRAELEHAVFSRANLQSATLTEARGKGTLFMEVDLSGAQLDGCALPKADFSKAVLERASLIGAEVGDAKLYEAKAAGARFERADISDARFECTDLRGASFDDARGAGSTWDAADLRGATFRRARLTSAVFSAARLGGAAMDAVRGERASFRAADLTRADLRGADLRGASFQDARLDETSLERANLHGAELGGASLEGARLGGALLSGTRLAPRRPVEA